MADQLSEFPARPGDAGASPRGRLWWLRSFVAWWIVCAALWMVLDDTTALPELVDGAVAATIGATAATLTIARSSERFAGRRRWLRLWWRPLTQFVADLAPLARLLAQALVGGARDPGGVREIPFAADPDRATRASQVALAGVAGSFAANSIVVAVDQARGTLIVHQLAPSSTRAGADPLGLG